jgi:hypothetical protein
MSGAGQKAPDWGAFWRFGVSLRDCHRSGVTALKYTLNKHVIGGARLERWIEI